MEDLFENFFWKVLWNLYFFLLSKIIYFLIVVVDTPKKRKRLIEGISFWFITHLVFGNMTLCVHMFLELGVCVSLFFLFYFRSCHQPLVLYWVWLVTYFPNFFFKGLLIKEYQKSRIKNFGLGSSIPCKKGVRRAPHFNFNIILLMKKIRYLAFCFLKNVLYKLHTHMWVFIYNIVVRDRARGSLF